MSIVWREHHSPAREGELLSVEEVVRSYDWKEGVLLVSRRFLAFWIDSVLSIGSVAIAAGGFVRDEVYQLGLIWILLFFSYLVLMEGYLGWTLGKRLMGIRVVDAKGRPPGLSSASLRTVLRVVDLVVPVLPIGMMVFGSKHQRLGDMAARTLVLYADDLRRRALSIAS